ncbi:hypothetical protein [Tenacibaculum sp. 190524A05c]|uniref:hypothetical protein n=1 Tax=Tenacibaculum platacis TaxID=3137852 RepID=UPI0032B21C51
MIENATGNCIPDPCKTLSQQLSNPSYKAKIEELRTKVGEKKESGYKQNKSGVYEALKQPVNGHTAIFDIDANTRGYMHTHLDDYEEGIDPKSGNPRLIKPIKIFSPQDVLKFLELVRRTKSNGIPIHLVYGTLVTGKRSYVLTFTGDVNFPIDQLKEARDYDIPYKRAVDKRSKSGLEKAFLVFLRDHIKVNGINLYRFKDNGTLQKKSLNNAGDLITDECQ